MSEKVWVTWKNDDNKWLVDKVNNLNTDADVDDLRTAFVEQQKLNISPGGVEVRETENGDMLKASTALTNYFVSPVGSAAHPGAGRDENNPLFLNGTIQLQRYNLKSEDIELFRALKKRFLEDGPENFGRPTPIETPTSLGWKSLRDLQSFNLISRLESLSNLPAILDSTSRECLSQMTEEHQLVAFMTSVFERILENVPIQVVNSEEYPWLVTTSNDDRFNQKPDNIFCHSAVYVSREPFQTTDTMLLSLRKDTDKHGILASWALRDSIDVIGEATMKIDNRALGEVVNYARTICFQKDAPKHIKLLLYDREDFWMLRATTGEINSVKICGWETPGSEEILLNFFQDGRSPWISLLIAACNKWQLAVESGAFLGKGAFGRVFKVSPQQEAGRRIFKALKLVLPGPEGDGYLNLCKEQEMLKKAAAKQGNCVARVEDFCDFEGMGAAMILTDVGSKVPRWAWRQLFSTLGTLHQSNIFHGDPRLANAIFVEGAVRWIDFLPSFVAVKTEDAFVFKKKNDLEILVKSCCDEMKTTMEIDLNQYNGTVTSAEAVFEELFAT